MTGMSTLRRDWPIGLRVAYHVVLGLLLIGPVRMMDQVVDISRDRQGATY